MTATTPPSQPHRLRRWAALATLCAVLVGTAPVSAQQPPAAPVTVPASGVPDAAAQPTTLEGWLAELHDAQAELDAAQAEARDAEAAALAARDEARSAQQDVLAARERLAALTVRQQRAAAELDVAQRRVDGLAAVAYVGQGQPDAFVALAKAADPGDYSGRRVLIDAVGQQQADALAQLAAAKQVADDDVRAAVAARARADAHLVAKLDAIDAADAALVAANARVEAAAQRVLNARAALVRFEPSATLDAIDIPVVALDAYQRAARYAPVVFPACQLDWYEIAGIARVESNHGRYGGSRPTATGEVVPPIRGIPLDGTRSARIADTDGGELDGDPVWDRAVGPTQFIPSTWRGYAARYDLDGNGDGREDPDNIYDAARATAMYLCRNGGTMTSDAERRQAFFSYNRSEAYVSSVLGWVHVYAAVSVPDLSGDPLATRVDEPGDEAPGSDEGANTPATTAAP